MRIAQLVQMEFTSNCCGRGRCGRRGHGVRVLHEIRMRNLLVHARVHRVDHRRDHRAKGRVQKVLR